METLQKLVPFFQELMQQWYELTMHNQEYAICLAISVWLLTAIFYSIRIGFLKRSNAQILKAKSGLQVSLNEAETKLQMLQQQLDEATQKQQQAEQQAAAEAQRAAGIEQRLSRSNQQLASSLSILVERFELNQDKLPTAEADNLLTEYDGVIARVAERFQNEQQAKTQLQLTMHAEAAKLAEIQALAESLQTLLDTQTQQLAKLEMAVEKYEAAERQMELDQQHFAQERKNHQAELARAAELEKQALASAQSQPKAVVVDKAPSVSTFAAKPIETIAKTVEPQTQVQPVIATQTAVIDSSTKVNPTKPVQQPKVAESKKSKGFFGRAMEKISKLDEKLGQPSATPVLEELAETVPVAEIEAVVESVKSAAAVEKIEKPVAGLNQKLTGLFDGLKKSPAKSEAVIAPEIVAIETSAETVAEAVPEKPAASVEKAASKLGGLFGKLKSKK